MRQYKKKEREVWNKVKKSFNIILRKIKNILIKILIFLKKEYSLLLVSHSGDKTRTVNLNMFFILCFVLVFIISIGSFTFLKSKIEILSLEMKHQKQRITILEEDYSVLSEDVRNLMRVSKFYREASNSLLDRFGFSISDVGGDFALFEPEQNLIEFTEYLENSIEPINQIHSLIDLNKSMIEEIPSTWPIKGGIGYVSMYFGLNEHPLLGHRYLHSGIDVSMGRSGDMIVSTANGVIVDVGYDPMYGNYILIKHGFDFYTRYAHLQSILVKRGQKVLRGERIGILGNTGLSTGPHIHYEIYTGSSHVDPLQYMILKN